MDGFVTRPAPAAGAAAAAAPAAIPGDGWAQVKRAYTQSRKNYGRAAIAANLGLVATQRG